MNPFLSWLLGRGASYTRKISWPDASQDKCIYPGCGVVRCEHSRELTGHEFMEAA